MRYRLGFVSNSSSSSFLIYGICLNTDDAIKLLKIPDIKKREYQDQDQDPYEFVGLIEKELGIDYYVGGPDPAYSIYIGKSWDSIKDNQTGKEFKKEVKQKLEEVFGKSISCATHAEGWMDG